MVFYVQIKSAGKFVNKRVRTRKKKLTVSVTRSLEVDHLDDRVSVCHSVFAVSKATLLLPPGHGDIQIFLIY